MLAEEPLVAVLPKGHGLSLRRALEAGDLAGEMFVLYPARPRPSYADHVLSLFRAGGHELDVAQEANELQTAIGLVSAGLGVTVVPASAQRLHRDDIAHVPIATPGFVSPVIASWRRGDASPFLAQALALNADLVAHLNAAGGASAAPA